MNLILNEKQTNVLKKSISLANELYKGNFKDVIDYLFNVSIDEEVEQEIKTIVSNEYETKDLFSTDLEKLSDDKKDVFILCDALELIIRTAIGQWENFIKINKKTEYFFFQDKDRKHLLEIRNRIIPIFNENGIYDNGSFGVGSKEIHADTTILYDIYKVLMYENGAGGVYQYRPTPLSKEPLPIVKFPYKKSYTNISKTDIDKIVEKEPKVVVSDHEVYVYTCEYCSSLLLPGNNCYLKRNDYWVVER